MNKTDQSQDKGIRICHLSTVHPPSDVRVFYRECCSLVQEGYTVHLVCPTEKSRYLDGVHIHSIKSPSNRLFRILFMTFVSMFKALRTEAVLYHYHDPELIFVGFMLRYLFRKKVIYDIHESVHRQIMSKDYLPAFTRKFAAFAYKCAELIFLKGQTLIVANRNCLSEYPTHTYLVQNYPMLESQMEAIVHQPLVKTNPPVLVYVGRVAELRGSLVYTELAAGLARIGYDFRMKIIGQYFENEGEKLFSKINKLKIGDRITVTGQMNWRLAMKEVSKASIGLCLLMPVPNYTTCLATKILEYMMMGTAVLASNFETWRDYVEGEQTGRMVNPENMDEVVHVCRQMLDNPKGLELMGQRGIKAVREQYNWSSEFKKLLECYERLVGSPTD